MAVLHPGIGHEPETGIGPLVVAAQVDDPLDAQAAEDRMDGSRPLFSSWAEWDLCLVGGVWDLYEESWLSQQRSRAERLAHLEAGLAGVVPSATFESFLGLLREALAQAPVRWPGSTLVVAGRWRRLPRRLRPWPGEIELLTL